MVVFGTFGKTASAVPASAPALQQLRAYWESLRIGGRLPLRSDIDPRGMAAALDQVFLIERIAPGHARFRLAGNQFHDLMGMDVRGMPLSSLFDPGARARLEQGLTGLFDDAAGLHFGLEAERGIGRAALGGRMLLLPLRGGVGDPAMALGALVVEGAIGRAPRRFAISSQRSETLFDGPAAARIDRRAAPQPQPQAPRPQPGRAPALRLVHFNAGE